MKKNTPFMIKALTMSCVLALTACGGGGGSGGTAVAPVSGAQGLWKGSTSPSVMGIVLDDGSYWLLYSPANVSGFTGGFVQGTGTSLNGSFSSSDAIDFNFSGQGVNNATVSASYTVKQSFNGSVSYTNLNAPLTFTSSYNADYDQTPSLAAIAGNFLGISYVGSSSDVVTLVISAQGVLAGTSATSGCQYGGLVKPHTNGNVYDVSLLISGTACTTGTNTVTGIGYFDASSKRLYLAAVNTSRTTGMGFSGVKP